MVQQQRLAISIPNISNRMPSVPSVGVSTPGSASSTTSSTYNASLSTSMDSAATEVSSADIGLFVETPLQELSANTRLQLSQLLNCRKILRSEDGYERDWRGVAELAEVRSFCSSNNDDPMRTVLREWCSHRPLTATFARLQQCLGIIDRWDVSDDIYENMVEDAKKYAIKLRQKSLIASDTTDASSSASTLWSNTASPFIPSSNGVNCNDINSNERDSSMTILTRDDVILAQKGLPPQQYDAFVLFADADIEQAAEIQTKFEENEKYNFKLCFKNRDLLGGVPFTHVALTQLIEERCRYLLVILTKEFLDSPENQFLMNYTHALQIQNNTRKIIPLIYEDSVIIPRALKIYTHLKYNPVPTTLFDFWARLGDSIRRSYNAVDPSPFGLNEVDNVPASRQLSNDTSYSSLPSPRTTATTPTSPTSPIPSININGHAYTPEEEKEDVFQQKEQRNHFTKRSSLRHHNSLYSHNHNNNRISQLTNGHGLRNAHSTSQLNASITVNNTISMNDLSINGEAKKKKKKPIKAVLKRVFSRSSPKLQETAE
ncbi:myeloid differentiation primary response protein MyD88-like [Anastrepha ludens]|uniref:myeloid differentiation primary response protein MyD88-like n=1 Tax=Anastrepha ludens TaxID=28586 RepID=UPI0023B1FA57|nr:myeloid differentiation primary response protein MyD88-like [Anastrepha ludens]XP_053967304.1 myeloid differentiation primary response protein MyD88-like [Anastrepha ludens]